MEDDRIYIVLVRDDKEDKYTFYSTLDYVNNFMEIIKDKSDWLLYEINRGIDENINISRLLKFVNYDVVNSNIIFDINPKIIGSGLN